MELAVQIDPNHTVITDCIVAGKTRIESNIEYLYAIGHLKRLYKIQVNNPSGQNPVYNNPVLLTTLANSQTFLMGGSMEFYGTAGTNYIWIGHDTGVTQINFDGSGETVIGTSGPSDWVANVPRCSKQFVGCIFYGNGNNIAKIDSTLNVTSYAVLNPGLPSAMQIRDLDVTSDLTYLAIVASEINLANIFQTVPDTTATSSAASMIAYWNGSDMAATTAAQQSSFVQTAYHTFAQAEYAFGLDIAGGTLANPLDKVLTLVGTQAPLPNAVGSNGNIVGWFAPENYNGALVASLYLYGNLDQEFNPQSFYRQIRSSAASPGYDVLKIPFYCFASNFTFGGQTSGYTADIIGIGMLYFSTIEYNGATSAFNFYYFDEVPAGFGNACPGVYETQAELFSKRQQVIEVRIYAEPAVANQSFQIDLIGIDGNVIANSTKQFTYGTTMPAGSVLVSYNPVMAPTPCLGLRISNLGTVTPSIHKVEIDITAAGR